MSCIQVDIGSEFISKAQDRWAYDIGVILEISRPGKPNDIPCIEPLNLYWFLSLPDAREKIESYRKEYYSFRSHSSLRDLTANEYLNKEAIPENSLLLTGT